MRRMWAVGVAVLVCLALGSVPAGAQEDVTPGSTVSRCSPQADPDLPGPVAQARPPMLDHAPVVFDPGSGQIVAFPTGAGGVNGETWGFDVCSNTWSIVQQGLLAIKPSTLRAVAYATTPGVIVGIDHDNQTWTYDQDAVRWEWRGPAPGPAGITRLVYDPVSDRVLAAHMSFGSPHEDEPMLWAHELDAGSWTELTTSGDAPDFDEWLLLAADPASGTLVAYDGGSGGTWRLDLATSAWSPGQRGPALRRIGWVASGGEAAVDEATGLVVVFSDGLVLGYDPDADTWQILYGDPDPTPDDPYSIGPLARIGHSMVYDPVNERLVVMGGDAFLDGGSLASDDHRPSWVATDDVWAFDTRTGAWTELLAPSVSPSASGDGVVWSTEPQSSVEYAPLPSTNPCLMPDADGFVFEEIAAGVRRLVTDGAGHFPSATYIREARDMDRLEIDKDGAILVWSTTHGIDNRLGGDRQLWVLGRPGVRQRDMDPYDPGPVALSATGPDGSTWTVPSDGWAVSSDGGVIRTIGKASQRFLAGYRVKSVAIAPDGRAWVTVGHDDGAAGGIYVVEPGAVGTPVDTADTVTPG